MNKLLKNLQAEYSHLQFAGGRQFSWSPETGEIIYKEGARGERAEWSLLHETGHALLGHINYTGDFELLRLEVDAWEKARELAKKFGIVIDEDHIQDCLDTYRDWLYKRSICPSCSTKALQEDDCTRYRCFNCRTTWEVSANRFARAYRRHATPSPAT
ncbi:MAG TPA: hypothetical protein VHB72_03145 [Candidatus Saccharimonadales bacterium]|nr:hypothetical protein [Candidatus Saccharimonadales bacterium]